MMHFAVALVLGTLISSSVFAEAFTRRKFLTMTACAFALGNRDAFASEELALFDYVNRYADALPLNERENTSEKLRWRLWSLIQEAGWRHPDANTLIVKVPSDLLSDLGLPKLEDYRFKVTFGEGTLNDVQRGTERQVASIKSYRER